MSARRSPPQSTPPDQPDQHQAETPPPVAREEITAAWQRLAEDAEEGRMNGEPHPEEERDDVPPLRPGLAQALADIGEEMAIAETEQGRGIALRNGCSDRLARFIQLNSDTRAAVMDGAYVLAVDGGLVVAIGEPAALDLIRDGIDRGLERLARRPTPPADLEPTPPTDPPPAPALVILSKRDFIGGFVPPDYLIDGIVQRGFLYGLTGQTGHGKSALALLIARLVGRTEGDAGLGSHAVDRGRVVYLAGENPDDLRIRIIGDDAKRGHDGGDDNISFIPGVFGIADMRAAIEAEARAGGDLDLIVVDTSAAYFAGSDEQANAQMGPYARMLRTLTTLPGRPAVIVLCHPIKHVVDPAQLLPRGGGAFLAEIDGNLTLWKKDDALIELWHGKMRGPGFEPMTFRLEKITTTALVDSRGRIIPTVRAVPVSEHEEEAEAFHARTDEDELLVAMLEPGQSVAALAIACRWTLLSGEPHKSKVHRVMLRLQKSGLVKNHRETWQLTEPAGKTAATVAQAAPQGRQHEARHHAN